MSSLTTPAQVQVYERDALTCNYAFYMMLISAFRRELAVRIPPTVKEEMENNYERAGYDRQLEAEDLVLEILDQHILKLPAFAYAERLDAIDQISRTGRAVNGRRYVHTLTFASRIIRFELFPTRSEYGVLSLRVEMTDLDADPQTMTFEVCRS